MDSNEEKIIEAKEHVVDETAADAKPTVTPPELPLDWTKIGSEQPAMVIRYPSDVLEFSNSPEETELTIVGTAGHKITKMGTDLASRCSPNLTHLVLRSHLIHKMEGLRGFEKLELLELYDNMVDSLDDLNEGEDGKPGVTLRVLDMSYNAIRDMGPVQFCPNLQELYLANNKLKTMAGLRHLSKLRKIDLGANRLRVMDEEELSGLQDLEELWLGKNKIERIGGISKLTKLRRLDVQSNRLTAIENLSSQVDTLEELYLANNGISDEGATCETGLALPFSKLNTLDLSKNRLTTTTPFVHIHSLEELWLSSNDIKTFDDVEPIAILGSRDGACLEGIYLEYNPVSKEFDYRKRIAAMLPSLNQIDADWIGGIASHGLGSSGNLSGQSLEARMKMMQELTIARARAQQEQEQRAKESGSD
mmetsp:Transcript_20308/g.29903  ORF Transcript_20308/g.29903 Transcript_20308/m.29903 type:complete len:420 (+) Transcript_20308:127-1386(+)